MIIKGSIVAFIVTSPVPESAPVEIRDTPLPGKILRTIAFPVMVVFRSSLYIVPSLI